MTPETFTKDSVSQKAGGGRRSSGKSVLLTALAVFNVALLVVAANKYLPEQKAHAQASRPSDYLMVPGTVTGVSTGVVFIVDTSKGELSAVTYNDTNDRLITLPKIDLTQVFKAGAAVNPGGGRVKPR